MSDQEEQTPDQASATVDDVPVDAAAPDGSAGEATFEEIPNEASDAAIATSPEEGVLMEDDAEGVPWYEAANNLVGMGNVDLSFQALLGTVEMPLDQFLKLGRGAIVELDQNKDALVEIQANGLTVGRADITVVEDKVGVIVMELGNSAKPMGDDMAAAMGGDDMDMAMAMDGGDDDMAAAMEGGEDDMAAMMAAMDNGE